MDWSIDMKKGEQPQLSAAWWKKNQPADLPTNAELEKAFSTVEQGLVRLKDKPSPALGDAVKKCIDQLAASLKKAQAELDKLLKAPPKKPNFDSTDLENTLEVIKKFPKLLEETRQQVAAQLSTPEDDALPETGLEKSEVYAAQLKALLPKLKLKPFAFGLAVNAESTRILFDATKAGKSLAEKASTLLDKPLGKTWGTTVFDEKRPNVLLLSLEGPTLAGAKLKTEKTFKALALTTFVKVVFVLAGKELPDEADDTPSEASSTAPTPKPPASTQEAAAKAAPTPKPPELNLVHLNKARLAWDKARKTLQTELEKLEASILAEGVGEPEEAEMAEHVLTLYDMLEVLDTELIDVLDQALNASDPEDRAAYHDEARQLTERYLAFVQKNSLMQALDGNPFVALTATSTVTKTLQVIHSVLVPKAA